MTSYFQTLILTVKATDYYHSASSASVQVLFGHSLRTWETFVTSILLGYISVCQGKMPQTLLEHLLKSVYSEIPKITWKQEKALQHIIESIKASLLQVINQIILVTSDFQGFYRDHKKEKKKMVNLMIPTGIKKICYMWSQQRIKGQELVQLESTVFCNMRKINQNVLSV